MTLFFIDVEAYGAVPALGKMTEFGIVTPADEKAEFHGILIETVPGQAIPKIIEGGKPIDERLVANRAADFIRDFPAPAIMVTDNPAFDFMWMADLFHRNLGYNPLGHSARRIGDFYAGLVGDWGSSQVWKNLRVTPHDHNPVNDARGNMEAYQRMLRGERATPRIRVAQVADITWQESEPFPGDGSPDPS